MARTANTQSQIAKLKKQLEALLKKENAIKSKNHEKTLAQIVKLAKENAISAKDIEAAMGSSKAKKATKVKGVGVKKSALKGAKVAPKYRNPSNHEQTWSGRGVSPTWVQALKSEGKLDSALIVHAVQVATEHVPTEQVTH
jgi:DNA-binding protein H-NS